MEITSDATKIRLAIFQLEEEAHLWLEWEKASKNVDAITWGEFLELFMG